MTGNNISMVPKLSAIGTVSQPIFTRSVYDKIYISREMLKGYNCSQINKNKCICINEDLLLMNRKIFNAISVLLVLINLNVIRY